MILVTGANGFVGSELVRQLQKTGRQVRGAVRNPGIFEEIEGIQYVAVGHIGPDTDWNAALNGIDTVIHLASRVHVMRDTSKDSLAEFREINTEGTRNLAKQAADKGIKRFVYVSTIKVNGERTGGEPFRESDIPQPTSYYAISKWEAEEALHNISQKSGMEVVIVRPPLVYGPGVRANFLRLMRWVDRGYPLPFGSVLNQRSLLYLGNFIDGLIQCIDNPLAANQTFLMADAETLSTPELIRKLAQALGREPNLIKVPLDLLRVLGYASGHVEDISRMMESLWVDSTYITNRLVWHTPFTVEQGLAETVRWYRHMLASA